MSLRTSIKSYSPFTLIFTMAGSGCRWKMVFSSTEHYILSGATNRQTWEVGRPASPAQGHAVQNHSSFSQGQKDQKQATLYRCLMGLHETWWASSTWMRKGENRATNELWLRTSFRMWHHDVSMMAPWGARDVVFSGPSGQMEGIGRGAAELCCFYTSGQGDVKGPLLTTSKPTQIKNI